MSKKFFEITNAIYEGKLPASGYWVVLPNVIFVGRICSQEEITERIKATSLDNDESLPIEKAMENIAAMMTMNEVAEGNPDALDEEIVTMVDVTLLAGDLEMHVPFAHILPQHVIAWGPGATVGVYAKEKVKLPLPEDRV
jgi:hypothetical protein